MNTKHFVIINPAAGSKDRRDVISASARRDIKDGEVEIAVTKCRGDAADIVCNRLRGLGDDEFLRIYACGGDGTVSEVVTGIYRSGKSNCALAVVPIGSGNDFVKYFDGVPQSRFRSLGEMSKAPYEEVDALLLSDEATGTSLVSLNMISFGFDAAVADGMNKYRRLPFMGGSGAYNLAIVDSLFRKRRHAFRVVADGEELPSPKEGYLFVIAGNGRYYGGGFKASPIGNIQDGKLDLVRIRTVSVPTFALLINKFRQGRHLEEMKQYASHQCCGTVKVLADGPIKGNIDGEVVSMTNPTVTVLRGAVKLIIPRAGAEENTF